MIKKLRFKLIKVSMLSLFIVFTVIMGLIGILNYHDVVSDADRILEILADNEGLFPKQKDYDLPPHMKNELSPELPYESRYFSVLLNEDGDIVFVDTGKIAAVDTETAMEYASDVWESGKTHGFVNDYRYIVDASQKETRIIFLDCGRSLSTFRSFVYTTIGVFIIGMLAVLFLIILLSGYITKPISESYEKQKRFITDAGHELKTPLTIIDADTEILTMDFGENEWISDIQAQTKRLAGLTNDLILLSRLEEDQMQFQKMDLPFSDIVEEAAHSFQSRAIVEKKQFSIHIEPLITVYGDEKMLRQLVGILLDNALKYTNENGTISISLKKNTKHVYLSVYNTTDKIDPKKLSHLFDRFYRMDASRNSQTGGHGLGLSIASAVVKAHKGKINAESADGQSLTIQVDLPIKN